jgi:hypothetical protein
MTCELSGSLQLVRRIGIKRLGLSEGRLRRSGIGAGRPRVENVDALTSGTHNAPQLAA